METLSIASRKPLDQPAKGHELCLIHLLQDLNPPKIAKSVMPLANSGFFPPVVLL
jgi:hypothetical protein